MLNQQCCYSNDKSNAIFFFAENNINNNTNIMVDTQEAGTLQSSSLTKDEVNTVIVSLRPAVAQARVHIIHQHARHVKNLKSKKCSSDKQKEQNERKIKRYVQEIELLKKSSRDSISRYVLITKKSFSDVVKKESKTQKYNMKVRSYVRVSEHAAVAKIVRALRLVKQMRLL